MGTVIAIELDSGVVIAGDTFVVDDGTVTTKDLQRVYSFDGIGTGVVGDAADIQKFHRQLDSELQTHQLERDREMHIDNLSRIAARLANETNVSAAVSTRDRDGTARLREVGPSGELFDNTPIALGSGSEMAFSRLDALDSTISISEATSEISSILEDIASRVTDSGGDIELWSLANDPSPDSDCCDYFRDHVT